VIPVLLAVRGIWRRDMVWIGEDCLDDGCEDRRRHRGLPVGDVPLNRPPQALLEAGSGAKPKFTLGPGYVEAAARLPGRLGGIPGMAPSGTVEASSRW